MNPSLDSLNIASSPGCILTTQVVTIQRDESGYGFSVSGDKPAYVISLRENGAAARAGVRMQDFIMKVNGQNVTKSHHRDVVQLIKDEKYITLTLGRMQPMKDGVATIQINDTSKSTRTQSRTLPKDASIVDSSQEEKLAKLFNHLEEERGYQERCKEEALKNASMKTQSKLAESSMFIKAMQNQLHTPEPVPQRDDDMPDVSSRASPVHGRSSSFNVLGNETLSLDAGTAARQAPKGANHRAISTDTWFNIENRPAARSSIHIPYDVPLQVTAGNVAPHLEFSLMGKTSVSPAPESPPMPTLREYAGVEIEAREQSVATPPPAWDKPVPRTSVINMEEEEFEDEIKPIDHGPFMDLQQLKTKPAHMSVFIYFLISYGDPSHLLCWLACDPEDVDRDLKKWLNEVHSSFLSKNASLRIDAPDVFFSRAEDLKTAKVMNEDAVRVLAADIRSHVEVAINQQLEEFRVKRSVGLGSFFRADQLSDNMDRNKEIALISETLSGDLQTLMAEKTFSSSDAVTVDKNATIAQHVEYFMRKHGAQVQNNSSGFIQKKLSSLPHFMGWPKKKSEKPDKNTKGTVDKSPKTTVTLPEKKDEAEDIKADSRARNDSGSEDSERSPALTAGREPKKRDVSSPQPEELPEHDTDKSKRPISTLFTEEKTSTSISALDQMRKRSGIGRSESMRPFDRDVSISQKKLSSTVAIRKTEPNLHGLPWTDSSAPPKDRGSDTPLPPPVEEEEERDFDLDVETEVPNWSNNADKKILHGLKSKEIKRQEIIHELIHTEKTHLRSLKVLRKVFYIPMLRKNIISTELLNQIFPNLTELIEIHESLLYAMKARSAESPVVSNIGDIMLERFDGPAGEKVKTACATFCCNQKASVEALKNLMKRDLKLSQFILAAEGDPLCRRLKFSDIIAVSYQRLTKYPLLLENIAKDTPPVHRDYTNLTKCVTCCKIILNYVNQQIKEAENFQRLLELSKKISWKSEPAPTQRPSEENLGSEVVGKGDSISRIDQSTLTAKVLILDGALTLKLSKLKSVDVQVLLLNDMLLLLQKQDDKFVIRPFTTHSGMDSRAGAMSPALMLNSLFVRNVATDKKAFFILNYEKTSPQIYEFIAGTVHDKKQWVSAISREVENLKEKLGTMVADVTARLQEKAFDHEHKISLDKSEDMPQESQVRTQNLSSDNDQPEKGDQGCIDALLLPSYHKNDTDILASVGGLSVVQSVDEQSFPQANARLPISDVVELLKDIDDQMKKNLDEKMRLLAMLRVESDSSGQTTEETGSLSLSSQEPRDLIVTAILKANHIFLAMKELSEAAESSPVMDKIVDERNHLTVRSISNSGCEQLTEVLTYLLDTIAEQDSARESLITAMHASNAQVQGLRHRLSVMENKTSPVAQQRITLKFEATSSLHRAQTDSSDSVEVLYGAGPSAPVVLDAMSGLSEEQ